MTDRLKLDERHKVLEIGTGSGYQTAILSQLCRRVYTIERYRTLAAQAGERFKTLQLTNITQMVGDGTKGWPNQAPFERIIVTAAATEIPPALLDQLADGRHHDHPARKRAGQAGTLRVTRTAEGHTTARTCCPSASCPWSRAWPRKAELKHGPALRLPQMRARARNPSMFKKILIANRGEIACRIIKTARRMGIKTVAVYSDADARALHVEMADEKVNIGPPPAAQSYLDIEKIVEACRQTGADAVHPGYGFLSERSAFPRALAAAGITFIGPNAEAIDAMGDKIESKRAAAAAGVSTVPGHMGIIADEAEAITIVAQDRLSGDDQGFGRRRRQGHAHRL